MKLLLLLKRLLLILAVVFCCMTIFSISGGGSDARPDPPPPARRTSGGRCEEAYVVGEGETLQTISVKCDNLFILEDNPAINDADDIGQGVVLYMRPAAVYSADDPDLLQSEAR